ncbi:hypothetical protein E3T55_00090 [Cryobacterium frigoriphilum]|uniref:Uncharacterized protein n=1 Tax=Cryobacterium frigoriphilum TaxID=1259150 RepID=A0A4V3IS76_9MICO|nr:hypothetical protein [Cryobacterium frigoriphilum]TFD56083.1 hypothetical protein E3T55_00090 [Cryobacterium frigoriphilum]
MTRVARSPAAPPAAPPIEIAVREATPRRRRVGFWLTMGGIGLVVLGLAAIGAILALTLQNSAAFDEAMSSTYTDTRNLGLSQYERSVGSLIVGTPMIIFLLAFCLLMLGELLRRARWVRSDRGTWRGATNTATLRVLSPRVHLAWIAAPVLVWAALIAVPVALGRAGGWPAQVHYSIEEDVWMLLGMYGALASGVAAVIAVSLVKKLAYARRVAAGTTLPAGTGSRFWRGLTYFWRFDLWLAFLGGLFMGPGWIALYYDDPIFLLVPLGIGLVFLALGVICALNFWRSAEVLAAAESVT